MTWLISQKTLPERMPQPQRRNVSLISVRRRLQIVALFPLEYTWNTTDCRLITLFSAPVSSDALI
jgi:hypothetical protein